MLRDVVLFIFLGCYLRHFKFVPPVHGRYLVGHVFRNFSIGMYSECEKRCVWERECLSVNIGPPIHEKVVCELSNSDHVQHPEDLKPRQGWTYRGTEVSTLGAGGYFIRLEEGNYAAKPRPRGAKRREGEKITSGRTNNEPHFRAVLSPGKPRFFLSQS